MTCGSPTALGRPEPAADTSEWIRHLAADPEGRLETGHRNADLLALHRRPPTPEGAVYREDVVYGRIRDRALTLRLYARACPGERRPAVLFFHGGGWVAGDPSMHMRHAHGLAARGFVTALVSYRLSPEVRWPEPLDDVRRAIAWMRANADAVGADRGRIAVAGASAGGHLAALAALDPRRPVGAAEHADVSSEVQAMVLWYPVVSLAEFPATPEQRAALEGFFGGPLGQLPDETAPLRMVRRRPPPTLLLCGDADETTPVHQVRAFEQRLRDAGGHAECVVWPGRTHAFDLLPGDWEASFEAAAAFLERVLAHRSSKSGVLPGPTSDTPEHTRHQRGK